MIYKLKFIIGIALLICTCLPLGSCQDKKIVESNLTKITSEKSIDAQPVSKRKQYLVPIMQIKLLESNSWILFLSLAWPIPILWMRQKNISHIGKQKTAKIIELLLSAFSVYIIYSFVFTLWYKPMIWGFLATILMAVYALLSLCEVFNLIWRLKKT